MSNKKIIITKINAIGALRQNIPSLLSSPTNDQFSGRGLKRPYCSYDNDNVTSYVQKKEWDIALNDYLFPPYVECEYVN
jgi:hypothetical protein